MRTFSVTDVGAFFPSVTRWNDTCVTYTTPSNNRAPSATLWSSTWKATSPRCTSCRPLTAGRSCKRPRENQPPEQICRMTASEMMTKFEILDSFRTCTNF